jgi:hypothetical protein
MFKKRVGLFRHQHRAISPAKAITIINEPMLNRGPHRYVAWVYALVY